MFVSVEEAARELRQCSPAGAPRPVLVAAIAAIGSLRSACDAAEAVLAGALEALHDGGPDTATTIRSATRCSQREAARRARLATGLDSLPRSAALLADGRITAETADALVQLADTIDPTVIDTDDELHGRITHRPADLARREIRDWRRDHETNAQRERRHERQVRDRAGTIHRRHDEATVLHAEFDAVVGAAVRAAVDAEVDRLWRHDGGRDGRPDEVRSAAQRRADAISRLLAGASAHPLDDRLPVGGGRVAATLVITADVGVIDGTDPDGAVEIVDTGPVPPSVLATLSPDTELRAALFAGPGRPLWLGRRRRLASADQRLMLALRDRGCRHCGAPTDHCDVHHTPGWREGGTTDIDAMALLCRRGHTGVHAGHETLVERDDGGYDTRPRPPNRREAA